jgi:hypothetical protein
MDTEEKQQTSETFSQKDSVSRTEHEQVLSREYISELFSRESTMLSSLHGFIRPETERSIAEKIQKQKKILLGISQLRVQSQEKIANEVQPVIDGRYFDKKPLNINLI